MDDPLNDVPFLLRCTRAEPDVHIAVLLLAAGVPLSALRGLEYSDLDGIRVPEALAPEMRLHRGTGPLLACTGRTIQRKLDRYGEALGIDASPARLKAFARAKRQHEN